MLVAKGARPVINVKMSSYTAKGGYGVPPKNVPFSIGARGSNHHQTDLKNIV